MSDLGQLIKSRREAAKLSQKKLGEACGLSDSEIMKIENGTRKTPNWKNLCNIAQALNMRPLDILLEAGYVSEDEIHPCSTFSNVDRLTDDEKTTVQLFIDFIAEKKNIITLPEGGC